MLTSILFVINRWSFFMSLFLGVLSAAVTNKLAGLENSSKAEIPNKKLLSETNQTGVLPNFFKKRFCFALRAISRLAVVAHSVEYTVHLVRRSLGEGGSLAYSLQNVTLPHSAGSKTTTHPYPHGRAAEPPLTGGVAPRTPHVFSYCP